MNTDLLTLMSGDAYSWLIDLTDQSTWWNVPEVQSSIISDSCQATVVEGVESKVHDGGSVDDSGDDAIRNAATLGHFKHGQLAARTWEY